MTIPDPPWINGDDPEWEEMQEARNQPQDEPTWPQERDLEEEVEWIV